MQRVIIVIWRPMIFFEGNRRFKCAELIVRAACLIWPWALSLSDFCGSPFFFFFVYLLPDHLRLKVDDWLWGLIIRLAAVWTGHSAEHEEKNWLDQPERETPTNSEGELEPYHEEEFFKHLGLRTSLITHWTSSPALPLQSLQQSAGPLCLFTYCSF